MDNFAEFLRRYKWRLLLVILGILLTVLILTIGFFRTLLLVVIVGIAYFFGMLLDDGGRARVNDFFTRLFGK